jgi:hypothetical protein
MTDDKANSKEKKNNTNPNNPSFIAWGTFTFLLVNFPPPLGDSQELAAFSIFLS